MVGSLHRHAGEMGREVLKFPRGQEAAASFCLQVWQSLGLQASVSTRSHPPYSLIPNSSCFYWLFLHCYALLPIVDWLGTDLFLLSQPIEICFCPSYHVVTVTKLGLAASGIYGSWWRYPAQGPDLQAVLLSLNEGSKSRQGLSRLMGGL